MTPVRVVLQEVEVYSKAAMQYSGVNIGGYRYTPQVSDASVPFIRPHAPSLDCQAQLRADEGLHSCMPGFYTRGHLPYQELKACSVDLSGFNGECEGAAYHAPLVSALRLCVTAML